MLFAFLIPLCGGGILFLCNKEDVKYLNLYHCVFSTFTVYSIMKGFLEIYGTTNTLLNCYLVVGVVLTFLTIFQYIKIRVKS
ncbi:MAG: hypothetical protein IJ193_03480 [Bacilli bacterium]|nr:hypothetical protein [Bacilli bacterium]